jgi:hypothetical protein
MLWNAEQMHFVGCIGKRSDFKKQYNKKIYKEGDPILFCRTE